MYYGLFGGSKIKKIHIQTYIIILITIFFINSIFEGIQADDTNRGILNSSNNNGEWIQEIGNNGGTITGGFGTSSNMATRGIEIYKGELYIGTQNFDIEKLRIFYPKIWVTMGLIAYKIFENYGQNRILLKTINLGVPFHGLFGKGCEVWKYNHTNDQWIPIISDIEGANLPSGFGHRDNFGAAVIKSFQDNLYVGTAASSTSGCEVWRWNGLNWEMVIGRGFGDRFNSGAWSVAEYNNELYLGTMNWNTGCQIWKTDDGENWEKVVLPGGDGFGTNWNVYAWSMEIYNDSLYVGTCNINRSQGCQLWRFDGIQWFKMNLPDGDGFGDPDNYGIRNIIEYNNEMYVSTATSYVHSNTACEIWRYDGNEWYPIVGDETDLSDGFGNLYNKYAWSMIKTSDDKLMVGTFNIQPLANGFPFDTYGCEIWDYDGYNWTELAGKTGSDQVDGGFGNRFNFGARSMIEYPENSGIIWVGTWNMDVNNFKIFTGCEIWRRI